MKKTIDIKSFEKAVSGIEGDLLESYFEERYERMNAIYNETAQGSAGALKSTYKKKLALIAAALALSSVVIAVPLALNNANDRPAPVIPTGPLITSGGNTAIIPTAAATLPRAETTAPETTEKQTVTTGPITQIIMNIIYSERIEIGENSDVSKGPGFIIFDFIDTQKKIEEYLDDENTYFYCLLDYKHTFIWEDIQLLPPVDGKYWICPDDDYVEEHGIEAYYELKNKIICDYFDQIGIKPVEAKDFYYIFYLSAKDIENLRTIKAPCQGLFKLLPEGIGVEDVIKIIERSPENS